MQLTVYKGFDSAFLERLEGAPLLAGSAAEKKNVLAFDKKLRRQLELALLSLEEDGAAWLTYEEYALIRKRVAEAVAEDGLELTVYRNNLFPDYYPIAFALSPECAREIIETMEGEAGAAQSEDCRRYLAVYHSLVEAEGVYYGGFYPDEGERAVDYYPQNLTVAEGGEAGGYALFLNEDIDTYLRDLTRITRLRPDVICLKSTGGEAARRMEQSLRALCLHFGIRLVRNAEKLPEEAAMEAELAEIAKNDIHIAGFRGFRELRFYTNPDIRRETALISQAQIIQEIIRQAERAYDDAAGNRFRDIFITASTGAGKSVMFQIPAVYLARKFSPHIIYHKFDFFTIAF